MDWVRGRPPDALLFLKAILKAAPSGLSVTPPTAPAAAGRAKLARTTTAEGVAPEAADSGGGGGGASRVPTLACLAPTESTARQSGGDTPGKVPEPASGAATTGAGGSGGGGVEGPRGFTSPPSIAAAADERAGVPTPRSLAEGALLAPLRDVGTVAGALRGGIGSGLREMAAARWERFCLFFFLLLDRLAGTGWDWLGLIGVVYFAVHQVRPPASTL